MSQQIDIIAGPLDLGEGPHWDEVTRALYFVDIFQSTIHKYIPESNEHTQTKVELPGLPQKPVSLIIPVKDDPTKFVISYGIDLVLITWDGQGSVANHRILASAINDGPNTRINDGKTSPSGVLLAGSMASTNELISSKIGKLYSFKDMNAKKLLDDIGVSNGLAWDEDEKTVYYIDSLNEQVEAFDYDANKAEISNRRVIFDLKKNNVVGYPDGMTIDTDGNLWIACYEGSRVIKIDPKSGTLLTTINLPTENITSVAFGGENLEDLYVTSARFETFKKIGDETHAGYIFRIRGTGSRGHPGVPIDIRNIVNN